MKKTTIIPSAPCSANRSRVSDFSPELVFTRAGLQQRARYPILWATQSPTSKIGQGLEKSRQRQDYNHLYP